MATPMRSDVFSLKGGAVIQVSWSGTATLDDLTIADVDDWLGLVRRKIIRTYRQTVDAANFIDPGCGSKFQPDFSIPGSSVECTRPYGHTPPCEGGGYSWGADLAEFEPIPAGSETAKTKAPEPARERRTFLGVDVDLPEPKTCECGNRYLVICPYCETKRVHEPPPAPCSHCSGSVINHAPCCTRPGDPVPCGREPCRLAGAHTRYCYMYVDPPHILEPVAPLPHQDEKPIEDDQPF